MDRQTGSAKKKKATSPAATGPAPVAVPNQEPFGPKLAALCYFGLFASLAICLTGILGLAILMGRARCLGQGGHASYAVPPNCDAAPAPPDPVPLLYPQM